MSDERIAPGISAFSVQRSASQTGRIDLLLETDGELTRPRRGLAQPPFQLSRVRYDDPCEPGRAVFTLLHLGGVLAGDRAALRVELGERARARVRMAAATQVYRMPAGDAAQSLEIRLGAGSQLEWLAEPLILFGGARFAQATRVILGPGARLALIDVMVPGRLARGERFAFERYESRLEIENQDGRCLAAERALLEPGNSPLGIPGVLGRQPVVGSLYLLGHAIDPARIHRRNDPNVGATALPGECGVLVRALGETGTQARDRLLEAWAKAVGDDGR